VPATEMNCFVISFLENKGQAKQVDIVILGDQF